MERRNNQGGSLFENSGKHFQGALIAVDPLTERHNKPLVPQSGGQGIWREIAEPLQLDLSFILYLLILNERCDRELAYWPPCQGFIL